MEVSVLEKISISDGTYIFTETDKDDEFLIFRKDDQVIPNDDAEYVPLEMYQAFMMHKITSEGMPNDFFIANLQCCKSTDGRAILIRALVPEIEKISKKTSFKEKFSSALQRILGK